MTLDSEMAQLLARMSVLSEVSGRGYDGIRVHGGEKSGAPSGPSKSLYDAFRRRWARAESPRAQRQTIEAAKKALTHAQHAPKREFVPNTLEWRVAIANDSREVDVVAEVYGCSRSYAYKLRHQKELRRAA